MKHLALFALVAPAALVAQTSAAPSLVTKAEELQKASTAEVNKLVGEFKFEEAVAKAAAFAETPFFPYPTTDVEKLAANRDAANEHGLKANEALAANAILLNGFVAHANALRTSGQWEKATAVLNAAAGKAEQNLAAFRASLSPIADLWAKLDSDAKAFIAANETRIKGIEAELNAEKARLESAWAEHKKKSLSKKEFDKLSADTKAFEVKAKAYDAEHQKLVFQQGNLGRLDTVRAALKKMEKSGEVSVILKKNAETVQAEIDRQKKEIDDFNAKQAEKKKPKKGAAPAIEGNTPWVNAVLADKNNLTNAGTPAKQAAFLNRLLVLDPKNEKAAKALGNVKAGRDPYFEEPKAKGGKGKAKK